MISEAASDAKISGLRFLWKASFWNAEDGLCSIAWKGFSTKLCFNAESLLPPAEVFLNGFIWVHLHFVVHFSVPPIGCRQIFTS